MGTTANYALRWPEAGAVNNVPSDMANLANDTDAAIKDAVDAIDVITVDTSSSDVTNSAPGDTKAAGVLTEAAAADHRHGRETSAVSLQGPAALTTYTETLVVVSTSGSTCALDLSQGREFKVTLNANVTFSFTNPSPSGVRQSFGIRLYQDGTGNRTVTWPANVNWGANGAPTLTTTATKSDFMSFFSDDGGTTWIAFLGAQGF